VGSDADPERPDPGPDQDEQCGAQPAFDRLAGAVAQQTARSGEMACNIAGVPEAVADIKRRLDTIGAAAAEADRLAKEGTNADRQLQAGAGGGSGRAGRGSRP